MMQSLAAWDGHSCLSSKQVASSGDIQPLAEWLGPRRWRRNNLLADGAKRGGACLHAHDLSSFPAMRPEPPAGVLASGTSSTDTSLCNLEINSHGFLGDRFCAL